MNNAALKWLKALRSGYYKQGKGHLNDGDAFCCLGVACELYRREHSLEMSMDGEGIVSYDGEKFLLPHKVMEWLELSTPEGDWLGDEFACDSLADLNDSGLSFEDIAKVIEAAPEGLFR